MVSHHNNIILNATYIAIVDKCLKPVVHMYRAQDLKKNKENPKKIGKCSSLVISHINEPQKGK